jgi:transcriptional regulator with XRE-family HTH domain
MLKELKYTVSKNIKIARTKRNLTQEQLSEISGIGYKYLQLIEGKNPPNISLKMIEKLAKALKTTPAKLLDSR